MRKLQANKSIEADSAGTEKICSVNLAIIYYVHATFIKHFQCFLRFHGYMQVPCKSIARATRNDSQSGIRMHQRTSYLIDRSVSSDSYYYIRLFLGSFRGYFYCMTGSLCIHYFPRVSRLVYFFVQQVKNQFFTLCSRNRIDDEFYFFHSFVHAILVDCRRQK